MPQPPWESAHRFRCQDAQLVGILHRPARPRPLGVLVVVGGPQYRVGSHRHFVEFARALSNHGVPVFRFDHRGIGDSEGDLPGFENIGPDIAAALATFRAEIPPLRGVVLWGLCDAVPPMAAAAPSDPFIKGLVLLNPWARDEASYDDTLLRHYYRRRLRQPGFWRDLLSGRVRLWDFPRRVFKVMRRKLGQAQPGKGRPETLAGRTVGALLRFKGGILLVMSGDDLTAREFDQEAEKVPGWERIRTRPGFRRQDLPQADHTFSDSRAKAAVNHATLAWLDSLEAELFGSARAGHDDGDDGRVGGAVADQAARP